MWYLKLLYTVSILLTAEHFHRIKCQTTAVQEISLEQYPFHVYVSAEKWGCSGILISKYYVVTPANCVNGSSETKVYLATRIHPYDQQYQKEESQIIRVSNLIVHDNFTKINNSENKNIPYYNNIALIKLSNAPTFGKKVHPGILASPEEIAEALNKNVYLTGWKPKSYGNLSISHAYLHSQQLPKNILNDQLFYMKWIDPKHILNLLGNVLSFKGKIIGFLNYGYYGMNNPIGLNLSPYLDWISRSTNIAVAELTGTPIKCEELLKNSEKIQKQNEIDHKTLTDTITTLSKKVDTTLESKASNLDLKLIILRVQSLENLVSSSIARIDTMEKVVKKNEFTQVALMDSILSLNQTIESTEAKILDADSKLTTKCLERLDNAEQSVTLLNQEIKNLKMEIFNLTKTITDIVTIINIMPDAS